jgi:hypothetical protein
MGGRAAGVVFLLLFVSSPFGNHKRGDRVQRLLFQSRLSGDMGRPEGDTKTKKVALEESKKKEIFPVYIYIERDGH